LASPRVLDHSNLSYPVQVWLVAVESGWQLASSSLALLCTTYLLPMPTSPVDPVVMVLLSSGLVTCTSTSLLRVSLFLKNWILFHWTFSWWGKTWKRDRDILSIMIGQNDRVESKVVEPLFCSSCDCDVMQHGPKVYQNCCRPLFARLQDVTQYGVHRAFVLLGYYVI